MGKGVKAGEAFVEILANTTKFQKGLKRAQAEMKAFGSGVQSIGLKIAASGVAMTAPFIVAAKTFADLGDELEKMSRRTGLSVEALSSLGFAAEQSGASLAVLEKGVKTMQRSIVDLSRGLSTQKDAFDAIGLTYKDLQSLSPEDQFKLIAQKLSQIENPTKKAATSLMLFGRAGAQLLPLMEDGAEGIEKLQKEAEGLGIVISKEQAAQAAEFTDNINRLFRVLQKGVFEIGQSVAPTISGVISKFTEIGKSLSDWIKENRNVIALSLKVAAAIAGIGTVIALLGTAIIGAAAVIGIFAGAIGAVISVVAGLVTALGVLISPIGLMIAAITVGAVVIVNKFGLIEIAVNALSDLFARLKDTFGGAITSIVESIKAGDLETAFTTLMAALDAIMKKGIAVLVGLWSDFKLSVVDAAGAAFETILMKTNALVADMRTAFVDVKTFILKQFESIRNGFLDVFDEVVGGLAKLITTDVRVIAEIDRQTTDKILKRRSEQSVGFKALDQEAAKDKSEIKQEKDNLDKVIKFAIGELVANVKDDATQDKKTANVNLIKSQKELADAIKDAANKTEDATEDSAFKGIEEAIKQFNIDNIDVEDPTKVIAQGGFNPFGLGRQNQEFQDKMLKVSRDNEKNTKKLARNQGTGAVFG